MEFLADFDSTSCEKCSLSDVFCCRIIPTGMQCEIFRLELYDTALFFFFFHFQFLWYCYNCLNICNVLVDIWGIFLWKQMMKLNSQQYNKAE